MAGPRSPRVLIAVVGVVVVAIVAGVVFVVTRSDDPDPAAVGHTCREGSAITDLGRLDASDARLSPFSADSVWRQPVEQQPTATDVASAMTANLRLAADPDGNPIRNWLNAEQYSMPVVQADDCDPLVTFSSDTNEVPPAGTYRVPPDAKPASGTDAHLLVVQPDGVTLVEMWTAQQISDSEWKAGRVEVVDLKGTGLGPDNGVRAYGGSASGGLIRSWEIDPTDPSYVDGVIRHPLAIAMPSSMFLYTEGDPGYDAEGYGTALGYVWPATEQDYASPWEYAGKIPMGAKVVLPRSVDIASLQLSPPTAAIAQALQDYGGFVTDRTTDNTVSFYAQVGSPSDWVGATRGPDGTGGELDRIRQQLVVVIQAPPAT
jgi:hypothetical protein